jgi:hypothetical protein
MPDDVILAKSEIIERCLRRIDEVYAGDPSNLHEDFTKQDSILLNIERACQAAIDMALRVVRLKHLGLPKESREAFLRPVESGNSFSFPTIHLPAVAPSHLIPNWAGAPAARNTKLRLKGRSRSALRIDRHEVSEPLWIMAALILLLIPIPGSQA